MGDKTMSLMEIVHKLCEAGCSQKEIGRAVHISPGKVRKILITLGDIETEELRLFSAGLSVDEIASKMRKSKNAVLARLPYDKGMYNSERPSKNALRIRTHRERRKSIE